MTEPSAAPPTSETAERISAQRMMPSSPADIFAVLRDPDGHVAIDSSGMLQSAAGAPVEAVGDRFVVHMDRESLGDLPMGKYDVEVLITRFVPDSTIEWTIHGTIKPPIGHTYGYLLEPVETEDGAPATRVTSYCDWSTAHEKWKPVFPVIDEKALRASLGVLERAVLRGYPSRSDPSTIVGPAPRLADRSRPLDGPDWVQSGPVGP